MYYLHKLEFDGMVNYIFSEKLDPNYNCRTVLVSSRYYRADAIRDLIALDPRVGVAHLGSINVYTYKGIEYTDWTVLAQVMGITRNSLDYKLRSYQNWKQEWPIDLSLTVNGRSVDRPRIIRGWFYEKRHKHILRG